MASKVLTPQEVSRRAIELIHIRPFALKNAFWHRIDILNGRYTAHCYAGFCDLVIDTANVRAEVGYRLAKLNSFYGIKEGIINEQNRYVVFPLVNPVQQVLGLDKNAWNALTHVANDIDTIVSLHNALFE